MARSAFAAVALLLAGAPASLALHIGTSVNAAVSGAPAASSSGRSPIPTFPYDIIRINVRKLAASSVAAAMIAAQVPMGIVLAAEPANCNVDCFRECDALAPGNKQYCKTQCDAYCVSPEVKGMDDVLRSDPSEPTSSPSSKMNNGIFGDSGVSYSKGVEDLLATAFGAKRQAKPVCVSTLLVTTHTPSSFAHPTYRALRPDCSLSGVVAWSLVPCCLSAGQ
jgi:hypothetical protein